MQLAEALEARGLLTRATAKRPKALTVNSIHHMPVNPFYIGIVTWGGVQQPGKHEPLIDIDTFARVQAVLKSHRNGPEKQRTHNHYLRSTIFCARCQSRLIFTRSRGRGGEYDYFLCLGRHQRRNDCELPGLPVQLIEDQLEAYYGTIELSETTVRALHGKLVAAMKRYTSGADKRARAQRKRITDLEAERRKLLQAYIAGAIELDLLKESQDRIQAQLADAGAALAATEVHWENIARNLDAALCLIQHFGTAYGRASKQTRRQMNRAVFEAVYCDVDGISYARLAHPFEEFLADDLLVRLDDEMKHPEPTVSARGVKEGFLVELLGRNSKRNNATRLRQVLAGQERDCLPARPTRSPQRQRRLDAQEQAQLLCAYDQGVMINDLAAMFGLSRTAVIANLDRLGAESRRGIVDRRIEEASTLYEEGSSLAKIGKRYGVYPSTVRDALLRAGVKMRPRPGSS